MATHGLLRNMLELSSAKAMVEETDLDVVKPPGGQHPFVFFPQGSTTCSGRLIDLDELVFMHLFLICVFHVFWFSMFLDLQAFLVL